MEKKSIPIIALALFAITILLTQNNVNLVYALALSNITLGFQDTGSATWYMPTANKYVVSRTATQFMTVDPQTHTTALVNKPSPPVGTTMSATTGCNNLDTCYSIATQAGLPDYIVTFRPSNGAEVTTYCVNIDSTGCGTYPVIVIAGLSGVTSVLNDGFMSGSCTSGSGIIVIRFNGAVYGDCAGTRVGVAVLRYNGGNNFAGIDDTANKLEIWSLTTATKVCEVNGIDTKTLEFYNDNWYPVIGTTTINKYSQTCVAGTGITGHGLTNQILDLDVNTNENLFSIKDTQNIALMNLTSTNISTRVATVNIGQTDTMTVGPNRGSYAVEQHQYGFMSKVTGTDNKFFFLDLGAPDEGAEEGGNNQVNGFCGNGTLRDCMGDSNALSGLVPANQNITSVGTTIGQGIGIINPNDENPKTNGVGLFLMLITGAFFAIALMSTVHTLNMRGYISASVKEIDPIFWLFLVVGTVSVAWYLDWIDDIIFAAMTVGLAGLIAFGVLKHFGRI